MPNFFKVKPAENDLDKIRIQLLRHNCVANSGKNSINVTSKRSINQFYLSHTTQYKQQNAQEDKKLIRR